MMKRLAEKSATNSSFGRDLITTLRICVNGWKLITSCNITPDCGHRPHKHEGAALRREQHAAVCMRPRHSGENQVWRGPILFICKATFNFCANTKPNRFIYELFIKVYGNRTIQQMIKNRDLLLDVNLYLLFKFGDPTGNVRKRTLRPNHDGFDSANEFAYRKNAIKG